jgi:hypothetical protein
VRPGVAEPPDDARNCAKAARRVLKARRESMPQTAETQPRRGGHIMETNYMGIEL